MPPNPSAFNFNSAFHFRSLVSVTSALMLLRILGTPNNLCKSPCKLLLSSSDYTFPNNFASSANFSNQFIIPQSISLINIRNKIGPKTDRCAYVFIYYLLYHSYKQYTLKTRQTEGQNSQHRHRYRTMSNTDPYTKYSNGKSRTGKHCITIFSANIRMLYDYIQCYLQDDKPSRYLY